MRENRRHQRIFLNCQVKISHPDFGSRIVKAKDFSDGGVFLVMAEEEMPPLGAVVKGQIQGMEDDGPILDMEVVRAEAGGVGLRFCDPKSQDKLH